MNISGIGSYQERYAYNNIDIEADRSRTDRMDAIAGSAVHVVQGKELLSAALRDQVLQQYLFFVGSRSDAPADAVSPTGDIFRTGENFWL